MKIHLIDGTYELFRAHFAQPSRTAPDGREVGAVRGLIQTMLALLRDDDVTHVGCAFDSVITSFRNDMFAGYKTGEGAPAELLAQFPLAEEATAALGLTVWPMVEFEADDAIASAVAKWQNCDEVDEIVVCSPDKDFAQLVSGRRVMLLDRRREALIDEDGVIEKYGVPPSAIPDYLALVGDSADGIPGVPRWGAKSAAIALAQYGGIEALPLAVDEWGVKPRGLSAMLDNLKGEMDNALLYKRLATLRRDVPITESLADLEWQGARRAEYEALCLRLGLDRLLALPSRWRED